MASLDEVATVAELREFLDLATVDDQARLEAHRRTAVDLIEKYTGRHILDRSGEDAVTAVGYGLENGDLQFFIRDPVIGAGGHQVDYRPASADPGFERTGNVQIARERILVKETAVIMRPDGDGWPERQSDIPFAATFDVGIPTGRLPEPFRDAVKFLVRELYEASALDALPASSILGTILAPYAVADVASPATLAAVRAGNPC